MKAENRRFLEKIEKRCNEMITSQSVKYFAFLTKSLKNQYIPRKDPIKHSPCNVMQLKKIFEVGFEVHQQQGDHDHAGP